MSKRNELLVEIEALENPNAKIRKTYKKEQIDSMSYEQMLRLWRFDSIGDSMFKGESGDYFIKQFYKKKTALSLKERVVISKRIGWEKT